MARSEHKHVSIILVDKEGHALQGVDLGNKGLKLLHTAPGRYNRVDLAGARRSACRGGSPIRVR